MRSYILQVIEVRMMKVKFFIDQYIVIGILCGEVDQRKIIIPQMHQVVSSESSVHNAPVIYSKVLPALSPCFCFDVLKILFDALAIYRRQSRQQKVRWSKCDQRYF